VVGIEQEPLGNLDFLVTGRRFEKKFFAEMNTDARGVRGEAKGFS